MVLQRLSAFLVLLSFVFSNILGTNLSYAAALNLPVPGEMVNLSTAFEPVLIKGIKIHPENPFAFDFIVDTGHSHLKVQDPQLKGESDRLIKYFLAAMTLPEKDLWVNLSPYEKNRMIADNLGQTEMGRDMLAQDYLLKQLTASLIYPEKELGKKFWDTVYQKAQSQFGNAQIPVNTFNKVWIVADKADIFERQNVAYVVGAHLKVMLEEDYKALKTVIPTKVGIQNHTTGSEIIRQIILPELEKEVNQGQNFAPLRQMYYSMILASWYKMTIKGALLTQIYGNQNKLKGLSLTNALEGNPEKIYQLYLQAYKKGVFNYIKEDINQITKQPMPRKYFSGGLTVNVPAVMRSVPEAQVQTTKLITGDVAMVSGAAETIGNSQVNVNFQQQVGAATQKLMGKKIAAGFYLASLNAGDGSHINTPILRSFGELRFADKYSALNRIGLTWKQKSQWVGVFMAAEGFQRFMTVLQFRSPQMAQNFLNQVLDNKYAALKSAPKDLAMLSPNETPQRIRTFNVTEYSKIEELSFYWRTTPTILKRMNITTVGELIEHDSSNFDSRLLKDIKQTLSLYDFYLKGETPIAYPEIPVLNASIDDLNLPHGLIMKVKRAVLDRYGLLSRAIVSFDEIILDQLIKKGYVVRDPNLLQVVVSDHFDKIKGHLAKDFPALKMLPGYLEEKKEALKQLESFKVTVKRAIKLRAQDYLIAYSFGKTSLSQFEKALAGYGLHLNEDQASISNPVELLTMQDVIKAEQSLQAIPPDQLAKDTPEIKVLRKALDDSDPKIQLEAAKFLFMTSDSIRVLAVDRQDYLVSDEDHTWRLQQLIAGLLRNSDVQVAAAQYIYDHGDSFSPSQQDDAHKILRNAGKDVAMVSSQKKILRNERFQVKFQSLKLGEAIETWAPGEEMGKAQYQWHKRKVEFIKDAKGLRLVFKDEAGKKTGPGLGLENNTKVFVFGPLLILNQEKSIRVLVLTTAKEEFNDGDLKLSMGDLKESVKNLRQFLQSHFGFFEVNETELENVTEPIQNAIVAFSREAYLNEAQLQSVLNSIQRDKYSVSINDALDAEDYLNEGSISDAVVYRADGKVVGVNIRDLKQRVRQVRPPMGFVGPIYNEDGTYFFYVVIQLQDIVILKDSAMRTDSIGMGRPKFVEPPIKKIPIDSHLSPQDIEKIKSSLDKDSDIYILETNEIAANALKGMLEKRSKGKVYVIDSLTKAYRLLLENKLKAGLLIVNTEIPSIGKSSQDAGISFGWNMRQEMPDLPIIFYAPFRPKSLPPSKSFLLSVTDLFEELKKVFFNDQAAISKPGGIDLDRNKMNMSVRKDAAMGGVNVKFNQAMIEHIRRNGFEGIEFKIHTIVPINLPMLLGLQPRKEERLALAV